MEARLTEVMARVQAHPHSGAPLFIPGVRRIHLTPYLYLVDYFVGDGEIVVQRFRHAARRPLSGTSQR